jgi:hypothetical protein
MDLKGLIEDLLGGWDLEFVSEEAEAQASRLMRRILARLEERDRRALRARYGRIPKRSFVETAEVLGVSRAKARQEVCRALRRARKAIHDGRLAPSLLGTTRRAPWRGGRCHPPGFVPIEEAARLTGYDEKHIRGWILPHHREVRRFHGPGRRLYVRRKDIETYARRQRRRGYGPRHPKC